MALIDPETGLVSDAAYGADSHAADAGQPSLFDTASDIVTKGVPLTGLSIVNSFANTAIEVGNVFGADTDKWSIDNEAEGLTDFTGQDPDQIKDYYNQHQLAIEGAGLAVGSLLPGLGAVKGFQLATRGAVEAAELGTAGLDAYKAAQTGSVSGIMSRATGLLPSVQKARIIADAKVAINSPDGLFNSLLGDKVAAFAAGAADQTIQSLIYETATAATMKASPLTDDQSAGDVAENFVSGALVGGGIGGLIDGVVSRGILNRIRNEANLEAMPQQMRTALGMGDYQAGDRANMAMNNLWEMPEPTTGLGKTFAGMTTDATIQDVKKTLAPLAENGDVQLTNGLTDMIVDGKNSGQLTKQDGYNTLARLNTVQRVTSDITPTIDDGSFFINKVAPKSDSEISFNQVVTGNKDAVGPAADQADLSLRYGLKDPSISPKIGTITDMEASVDGSLTPKYTNSADAFSRGVDIFVNAKGQPIVNPNAPNIIALAKIGESRVLSQKEELARASGRLPGGNKPLLGSAVTLTDDKPGASIYNVNKASANYGAQTDSALVTIGDHGGIVPSNGGVTYGTGDVKSFSGQTMEQPSTGNTKFIDASARYAWATDRGIRTADSINSQDIPMMEQLYQTAMAKGSDGYANIVKGLNDKKVTVNGGAIPSDPSALLQQIRGAKDATIHDLIQNHSEMSSEEVAMRANVPENYLKPGNPVQGPQDYMQPTSVHTDLTHVQAWYDIGNLNHGTDGQILKGLQDSQYRVQLVKQANQDALATFMGKNYKNFIVDGTADQAELTGGGGKFITSSNGDYGTLLQKMERVGRFLGGKNTQDINAMHGALVSVANAMRQDPEAAADWGMFTAIRQRSSQSYSPMPLDLEQANFGTQTGTYAVLSKALSVSEDGKNVWDKSLVPDGFVDGSKVQDKSLPPDVTGLRTMYQLNPKTAAFEGASMALNDARVESRNLLNASKGIQNNLPKGTLYAPPIDTSKSPFFVYIKARPGTGMADDSTHVITASSQEDLQAQISRLAPNYSVFTKSGDTNSIEAFHEAEGDYQYDKNFASNRTKNDMARAGILNQVFPTTDANTLVQNSIDWHTKQIVGLNRDFTELGNGQLFAELRALGDRFTNTATSKTGQVATALTRQAENPYQDYINTALGVSQKDQYKTWAFANDTLESTFNTAFNYGAKAFQDMHKGLLSPEDANLVAQKYGLGDVYGSGVDIMKNYYGMANKLPDSKMLSKFVATANTIMSTGIIRLDAYQSLIHVISTPMLAAVEAFSAKSRVLQGLTQIAIPDGSGRMIPGTAKLLFNAVKNYFDPEVHAAYGDLYDSLGADKTVLGQQRLMTQQLQLPYGKFTQSKVFENLQSASDIGATLSGSNWSQKFIHFITADTGRQIFEAAGLKGEDLTDQIMTFSNRVNGNYVAGQRPVAFQGPLGQAVGLFQTFYFNLMQNVFRHVENGEGKTLALLGGLQTSLFGLQGMPGFQAINNHIVGMAAGNPNHNDLYTGIANGAGSGRNSLGDYLLYGVTSNWLDAGLYSRGDISPRSLTLLPTNPLDFPAIKGGIGIVGNIYDTAKRLMNGAAIGPSLLVGLEHNGLNRPLAGLARLAQGFSTNSQGNLVSESPTLSNNAGTSEMFSMANFSRILGARSLDEAVAQDESFRNGMYTAKTEARIQDLGQSVKMGLYGNGQLSEDQVNGYARDYASAGGDMKSFSRSIMKWTTQANTPAANRLFGTLRGQRAQNMMQVMGGQLLPDYTTIGSTAVSDPQDAELANAD